MEHAWDARVLLVSLTFITLSSCFEVSVWSGYYMIITHNSTNWNNWAKLNQVCKVFQGSILNCTNIGYKSSLVGFNETHCATCYPVLQGVSSKLSELNFDMFFRYGKSHKYTWLHQHYNFDMYVRYGKSLKYTRLHQRYYINLNGWCTFGYFVHCSS